MRKKKKAPYLFRGRPAESLTTTVHTNFIAVADSLDSALKLLEKDIVISPKDKVVYHWISSNVFQTVILRPPCFASSATLWEIYE